MKAVGFFIKKLPTESGVMVSAKHLQANLQRSGIETDIVFYEDDPDLIRKVERADYACINLHVPSFTDETLQKLLHMHDNVILSIHSTICNLQTEGEAFERLLRLGNSGIPNLRFTCPSRTECYGLNALTEGNYIFLPNTFSYPVQEEEISRRIENKSKNLNRPLKVSLFCEYRPMKNILTQVAALVAFQKKTGKTVELHVFSSPQNLPIYKNLISISRYQGMEVVVHERMSNYDCFKMEAEMDLGLQVSLSETLSYVAFEQMIQGVPVIGSDSISFASCIASYSNVLEMQNCIEDVFADERTYHDLAYMARRKAEKLNEENIWWACRAAERMIEKNDGKE